MLKGRKFVIILLLGVAGMLLLISVTIPFTFSTKAMVPYSLDKTMEQVRLPAQLEKWFFPFARFDTQLIKKSLSPRPLLSTTDHELLVESSSPATAILKLTEEGNSKRFNIVILPDPQNSRSCIVKLPIRSTFWKRMIDPDPLDELAISSIKNLGEFTNDTKRFYGFHINREAVTDSSYLYITTTVKPDQKVTGTKLLFDSLAAFATKNNITWNGKRIFYSQLTSPDELQLFASIAINSAVGLNPAEGISKKMMPMGKNLLVADFRGAYKDVAAAFRALEQYKRDYSLVSMAIPFEDFKTPGYGFAPEDTVEIKVCYPVY